MSQSALTETLKAMTIKDVESSKKLLEELLRSEDRIQMAQNLQCLKLKVEKLKVEIHALVDQNRLLSRDLLHRVSSDVNEKLDDDLEYFRRQIEHSLEADEHVYLNARVIFHVDEF